MEKINADYKLWTWNTEAKLFKMGKREVASLKTR